MELSAHKHEDFTYQGRACSVRAVCTLESEWQIQAFVGNLPVGAHITLSAETISDAKVQDPSQDLLAFYMAEARREVEAGNVDLPDPSAAK